MEPTRHPFNTQFMWPTHRGPFRRVTEAQAQAYDDDGFFVLENALDPDVVSRVRDEIDPYEEKSTRWLREKHGGSLAISDADAITFTTHLAARSPYLREFVLSEPFQGIAHDLVGPTVRLYWDQAVYKKPEKPRPFPWHQDNGYTYVEPQAYLTCWIPLVDATMDNGCPVVVPGLHRMGTLRRASGSSVLRMTRRAQCPRPRKPGASSCSHRSHRISPGRTRRMRYGRRILCSSRPTVPLRFVASPALRALRGSRRTHPTVSFSCCETARHHDVRGGCQRCRSL